MQSVFSNFELPPSARVLLAVGVGASGALSQAPFGLSVFMFVLLSVGVLLWRTSTSIGSAFLIGWVLGMGYFTFSLRWILEPFQVDAAAHAWMAPFALALLAMLLSLFWGAAFALARWTEHAFALIVTWTGAELLRAYLFTGFPWANPAQALLDTPLAAGLSVLGPYGLMLVLMAAASLILVRHVLAWGALAAFAVLLLLPYAPAAPEMTDQRVRIIQPNAPQHEKWDRDLAQSFVDRQLRFTAEPFDQTLALVLWPETAIPYIASVAQPVFNWTAEAARGAPVLLGVQRDDPSGSYHNSAVLIGRDGQITETYDKHHLVPFGEYMPFPWLFRNLGIAALAQRTESGYSAGPGPETMPIPGLGNALILICYEAVFPQDTRSQSRPDLAIQLTNDAWFGQSVGPQQHLALARMRAIEQGLPLVRSANTGISAMIGPRGALLDQLPLNTAGFLDARVPAPLPQTIYARTGDLPLAILLLGVFAFFTFRRTRH